MPQLVKGGKWVFGWVVVQPDRSLPIPPDAWQEYGLAVGEETIFMRGSRTSGGVILATPRLLAGSAIDLSRGNRLLGRGRIDTVGQVTLPESIELSSGQRLLAARGSGHALALVQQGPIVEEARRHPGVEVFGG